MTRQVDPAELIDATQVAQELGLSSRNSVSVYRQRYADFPAPVVSRGSCFLWVLSDIQAWQRSHRRR